MSLSAVIPHQAESLAPSSIVKYKDVGEEEGSILRQQYPLQKRARRHSDRESPNAKCPMLASQPVKFLTQSNVHYVLEKLRIGFIYYLKRHGAP